MARLGSWRAVVAVLGAGLIVGTALPASGIPPAPRGERGTFSPAWLGGRPLWAARHAGPAEDSATSLAMSPNGSRVFVTGASVARRGIDRDYVTIAYRAATGDRLWFKRYDGPGNADDAASTVVVAPDGSTVFVTGRSQGIGTSYDYTTIAYGAAAGVRLWVRRYDGPAHAQDEAVSAAMSSDGSSVFVTGRSHAPSTASDYYTIAYDAATGVVRWRARASGPGAGTDVARSVAVSADGSRVFVTGKISGTSTGEDYYTIAYDAARGARLWETRYDGPARGDDGAISTVVSPDGSTVYVTGRSQGVGTSSDYATIAYGAATGASQWEKRYDGPASGPDAAASVVLTPDGSTVYVTGRSQGVGTAYDYATIAYGAATGAPLWLTRHDGPAHRQDEAASAAVGVDGATVFVTGRSVRRYGGTYDYATIAYDAATGARVWGRGCCDGTGVDNATSIAVSPDGTVVVTGRSEGGVALSYDYLTVAYRL